MTAQELKRLLPDHADDGMATHILAACQTTKLPLSYGLALVEKESDFQNVFGHDGVENPVKGGRVTRVRYVQYKRARKAGKGMQGVGYTQLTWYAFQDQADALGGCWKAYPNLVVGFSLLGSKIKQLGRERGAAAYNGTGDAADAYGRDFMHKQALWHARVS